MLTESHPFRANWSGGLTLLVICTIFVQGTIAQDAQPTRDEIIAPREELRISAYLTASTVRRVAAERDYRRDAVRRALRFGVTKVFIEVSRGGTVLSEDELIRVRDHFESEGFTTAAGIATVPGGDVGVRQEGQLGWFNWQNPKTRADLEVIARRAARVFDEFVIDDFLCTADVSAESLAARSSDTWPDYRRRLMTEVAWSVFIGPARAENPDIRMIIKYPQWYDMFHRFGYDVPAKSRLFDKVWVGTESRGFNTQRFGFMPPYEGFVNYRWIADISGAKTSGAWFDHGDCDANDFVDQAYQTVLAGAPEITLFNFNNLMEGHPGHIAFREQYNGLADLASVVQDNPVTGVSAYKPPNSEAGLDINIIDHIGMLGVPIVPVATYPSEAPVIFLPTQAAADTNIANHIDISLRNGARVIMTRGFLSAMTSGARPAMSESQADLAKATTIEVNGESVSIDPPLNLSIGPDSAAAVPVLTAIDNGVSIPFLTRADVGKGSVYVLNTYTYTQEDFDAVGEVLLAPQPLGLMTVPNEWVNTIRRAFIEPLGHDFTAPARITLQPLGDSGYVIQNYRDDAAEIELVLPESLGENLINGITGKPIPIEGRTFRGTLAARDRIWMLVN
jgi:hypothetical protein